ncbi:MAG TPA: ABC transporter ATP-binding protein [Acidimicrobiales bacterium]|jgi:branched-chain amino acid transport system ATP-binding protein
MTSALACDLTVGYQGIAVARDVSLEIERGQVVTILGPNGAGKTTLLLTLAGFLPVIEGTINVGGRPIRDGSARRLNRAGVVLVPDNRALFTQLTVTENLAVAKRGCGREGPSVSEVLDLFPPLHPRVRLDAGMLSGGEQQMLALARALVQGPRVLLIDEMSMGLAPVVVEALMPTIRTIADEAGTAVVLVEQHVRLALEVADYALVMVHGDVVLHDRAVALRNDMSALEKAYLTATLA